MTTKLTTKQKRRLLDGVPHYCAYCGISEEDCRDFFNKNPQFTRCGHRGKHLEVDRVGASKPYEKDNVVWACYVCNNSKSNYCNTANEFKPIADGIRKVWQNRGYTPVSTVSQTKTCKNPKPTV